MRHVPAALLAFLLPSAFAAQPATTRSVVGETLESPADPPVTFVTNRSFHYAGGQVIDIMGVAGAEQHFFIDAAPDHSIRRFCWFQFEHYYPDNTNTYTYAGIKQSPVRLGQLEFMGDVRARAGYFTMDERPGSDSRAAADFLRARGYRLEGAFVTLRLFHLPDSTHRKELMVIYGEVLPAGVSEESLIAEITAHARANLTTR